MSTAYTASTPSRYLFNPARVYVGNLTQRKFLPTRGGVTATESKTLVAPQVDGIPEDQMVEGNIYKGSHSLVLAFAAVEVDTWLQDVINDGAAGVTTTGDTVWTPRPNYQLYPASAFLSDVRVLGDLQSATPTFYGYHIPRAILISHNIGFAASGEAPVQLELRAVVPSGVDPRTHVPFTRIQRDDLTF